MFIGHFGVGFGTKRAAPPMMSCTVLALISDFLQLIVLGMRSHTHLAAENLFLRRQLAFYGERRMKPRRLDDATRLTLVVLARFIEWRCLLMVVQPETLVHWHRTS